MLLVFAAVGGGIAGALIMFFGYFVGVALVGAGIGAMAVHMIWSRLGTDPQAFVVILAAVAGAAGAMALQRYVIVVATAFCGAWTLLWSGLHLFDRSQSLPLRPSVWMVYPFDLAPGRTWMLTVWLAMGLVGVFIQLRFTGRVKAMVRAKPARPK